MRVEKGILRHELAQVTGMTRSSLYRLESGMVKNPPLWWYQNCAIALGIKVEEILDYAHQGWHGTPRARNEPPPNWVSIARARRQGTSVPPAASRRGRKGSLAAP
jgi:DNA-binding Xre family transcriptional regulator